MKKILIYLTCEKHASVFDQIVSYDSSVDVVIPKGNTAIEDVEEVIHGCVFTRHPKELRNTAIFIGGHDTNNAESLLTEAKRVLMQLPDPFSVSIGIDPDGAYTTAAACVAKVLDDCNVDGSSVLVLAGTGPVGQGVSVLFAKEGASVTLASRKGDRAAQACKSINGRYGVDVKALQVNDERSTVDASAKADIIIATGPEGITLIRMDALVQSSVKVLADVNAVPPYGIGGVGSGDDGIERSGRKCFGALAIGNLKMSLHKGLVESLFEHNDLVLGLDEIYNQTKI